MLLGVSIDEGPNSDDQGQANWFFDVTGPYRVERIWRWLLASIFVGSPVGRRITG